MDPISGRPFIDGAGRHVPPPGADWEEHVAGLDCLAYIEGDAPRAGRIVPSPVAPEAPRPAADRRLVAEPSPLRRRSPRPEPTGCPECSRIVKESPSPGRAFAWLVVNDVHREHVQMRPLDDLPF